MFTENDFKVLTEELEKEIKNTIDWAKDQDDPNPEEEIDDIFAKRTTPIFENDESSKETMNFIEAITNGLNEVMEKDEDVFIMGEDIGVFEGAFKATKGLYEKFGSARVLDTPISEGGFMGAGVGAALAGKKPIIELQFYDFVYPALDQITTEAAKYYWKAGKPVPLVVRGPTGAGTTHNAPPHPFPRSDRRCGPVQPANAEILGSSDAASGHIQIPANRSVGGGPAPDGSQPDRRHRTPSGHVRGRQGRPSHPDDGASRQRRLPPHPSYR